MNKQFGGNPSTDTDDIEVLIGEKQASPSTYTVLDRLKALLTGIVLAAGTNKIGSVNIRNNANNANIDPLADSTFTARIGEVQATPSSNTVLDRLKALLTGIVLATGTNVVGKVGIDQTTDGTTNKVQARNSTHGDFQVNATMQLADVDVSNTNAVPVKVGKGSVTTAHAAITGTATSAAIDCTGYNAVMVIAESVTETWKLDVQGSVASDGTYVDLFDGVGTQMTTGNLTAARGKLFVGIPNHIKIVATEVVDEGACTVKVIPMVV